jgi:ribonuclease PH
VRNLIEQSQLIYFIAASAALTLLPGPDILFVLTQSISQGKKAGIATASGLSTGVLAHTTAAALGISDIPWDGPVGAVRVAKIDGQLIANPSYEQREKSAFEILLTGKDGKINMIEAGAKEVPESELVEAMRFGQKYIEQM